MGIHRPLLLFVPRFLLLLAMIGALIFTAAVSVMGMRSRCNQEEPTCGGCGYIVKKRQTSPVCPICHAEFQSRGHLVHATAAGRMARRGRGVAGFPAGQRAVSLGIWTIVAGMMALGPDRLVRRAFCFAVLTRSSDHDTWSCAPRTNRL